MQDVINPGDAPRLFSPTIRQGDLIFVSGQGGFVDNVLVAGGVEAEAAQVLTNIDALLMASGSGISDVVAVTCYLVDIGEWEAMNAAWSRFFEGKSTPTRTAIGVAGLPRGIHVEMTAIAAVRGGPRAN